MSHNLYRLSPLAEQDLEKIWLYTYQEWSLEQADKYILNVITAIESLAKGKSFATKCQIREGYWKYLIASHVVYFVKNNLNANSIDVIRILHKSMDTESHLQ